MYVTYYPFYILLHCYRLPYFRARLVDGRCDSAKRLTKNQKHKLVRSLGFYVDWPARNSHIFVKLWHPTSRASKYNCSFMAIFLFTYYNLRDMADALVCGTQEKPNHWNANNYPRHIYIYIYYPKPKVSSNAHSLRKGNVQSTQQVKRLLPYSTVSTISSLRTKHSIH